MLRVQYSPTGHLVFLRNDGTLHALPFDARRVRPVGQPFLVMSDVFSGGNPDAWFWLSAAGTLSVWRGAQFIDSEEHQLWWYDRSGRAAPLDSSWRVRLGAAGMPRRCGHSRPMVVASRSGSAATG